MNWTSSDAGVATRYIHGAVSFIEKYCNRAFALQEHDEVFTVANDGSIILTHIPVSHITRFCRATGEYATITNTAAELAAVSTTADELKIMSVLSGTTTNA